jgi:hypothetical protein
MSEIVNDFLGRTLEIPGDRLYLAGEGLWIKEQGAEERLAVGLSEPALLMSGPVRQVEGLAEPGSRVRRGQEVMLALTAKIKYLVAPLEGVISFPPELEPLVEGLGRDPYGTPLFFLAGADTGRGGLCDAAGYARSLDDSDGSRNPTGAVGPGSSTCKAIYMGLAAQKLE